MGGMQTITKLGGNTKMEMAVSTACSRNAICR